jgi:hypothetical protein
MRRLIFIAARGAEPHIERCYALQKRLGGEVVIVGSHARMVRQLVGSVLRGGAFVWIVADYSLSSTLLAITCRLRPRAACIIDTGDLPGRLPWFYSPRPWRDATRGIIRGACDRREEPSTPGAA